jgi:hypothetical protein
MTDSIAAMLAGSLRKSMRPGMVRLRDFVQGRPAARRLLSEVKSVEHLIAGGQNPLHAAYTHAQNWLSVFSEVASKLREFEMFTAVVVRCRGHLCTRLAADEPGEHQLLHHLGSPRRADRPRRGEFVLLRGRGRPGVRAVRRFHYHT